MMSGNNPNRKRLRTLFSFYKKENDESSSSLQPDTSLSAPIFEVQNLCKAPRVDSQRVGCDQEFNINSLERDPGLRRLIDKYPVNEHDNVRRSYILLGPCQPKLAEYPSSLKEKQFRRFQESWFKKFPWLEYSIDQDKAFCFPCFLFDKNQSHPTFVVDGFDSWKRVGGKNCAFQQHVGNLNSPHHLAMQKWSSLKNPSHHIEKWFKYNLNNK